MGPETREFLSVLHVQHVQIFHSTRPGPESKSLYLRTDFLVGFANVPQPAIESPLNFIIDLNQWFF